MIKKIISGGQTGAGQAALDVALAFELPYGGWIPRGRKTENGPLPQKYHLKEADSASYTRCAKDRVRSCIITFEISFQTLRISANQKTRDTSD